MLSNGIVIPSSEGLQEDDPLGAFLFCLALQPVLKEMSRGNLNLQILAYMDDISIIGPQEDSLSAFEFLVTELYGLI
jgi:hypothetical protein